MIFLFNYIKLGIWSSIYYFQKQKSEIVFDIIIQNIKNSGCIALKFVQWTLPKIENIYNIDREDSNYEWFTKLESIYENCNYHSFLSSFEKHANITQIHKDGSRAFAKTLRI